MSINLKDRLKNLPNKIIKRIARGDLDVIMENSTITGYEYKPTVTITLDEYQALYNDRSKLHEKIKRVKAKRKKR